MKRRQLLKYLAYQDMRRTDREERLARQGKITLAGSYQYRGTQENSDPLKLAGRKAKPILSSAKRKGVAQHVEKLFREDWRLSPFEREGPIRQGLRSAFCLEGHSWGQSDNEAEWLIDTAIRSAGLKRPTFMEGQREHATECDFCSWCAGPIDEEGRTKRQRFCSDVCARSFIDGRSKASMNNDGGALLSAYRLIRKEALPVRACKYCGTGYKNHRLDAEFCSASCAQRWSAGDKILKDIECEGCGKVTKPHAKGQKFCSIACKHAAAYQEKREELGIALGSCANCQETFTPSERGEIYCSDRCRKRYNARAYVQRKSAKKVSHHFSCACCGEGFETRSPRAMYCSRHCAETAQRFDAGKVRNMAPRVFDHLVRREGARVTTDFQAAA